MKDKNTILIANGVNLDLLGTREPEIYGAKNLENLTQELQAFLSTFVLKASVNLEFFQSNSEEAFLDKVSQDYVGALINPGAWTHTSLALADRLSAVGLPFVEVHLSHIGRREDFRKHSYSSQHALGVVYGLGFGSYYAALAGLLKHLNLI